MTDRTAGEMFDRVARDALEEERKLKESLAQRSATVITTAGALVTLSLGISALITRTQTYVLPAGVLVCVAAALACLCAAAVLALLNNMPVPQLAVELPADVAAWDRPAAALEKQAYLTTVRLVADLRAVNGRRSRRLMLALLLECVAVAALATGAAWILLSR